MSINVVLVEPEIPQNTGNIIRTCVATNVKLHLIEPLGFDLYKKDVKRSTANHLEGLEYQVYKNFDEFLLLNNNPLMFFSTRYANKAHSAIDYSSIDKDIYLVFGKESTGIPLDILKDHLDNCMRIPMTSNVRALNVSNSVAVMVYEALRQLNFNDLLRYEPHKDKNIIKNYEK